MISINKIEPLKLEVKIPSYLDFNCEVDYNLSDHEKFVFKISSKSLEREDDEFELFTDEIEKEYNNLKRKYSKSDYTDEELYHYSISLLLHEMILMEYDTDYGEDSYYMSGKHINHR